jgi:hypothetical protein
MILKHRVSTERNKKPGEKVFFLLTREEQEIIEAIREAKDPTAAILTAVQIIKDFLERPLSLREQEDEIQKESA